MNEELKIVVLGAGESGVGAAILALDKGFAVFLSDAGKIQPKYREILEKENIDYEEGGHTLDVILEADLVIKSPGIPNYAPVMKAVIEKDIPVISEIEFAGRFTTAKMICITGSNGKTTTTSLIYHILQKAGLDVGLAGNIGRSLAYQVSREPHEYYVVELSSFQLENMYNFKANVAVLMNITPDHLDRYDYKMENYIRAKFRIINNMTQDDAFIYWQDDPVITSQLKQLHSEAQQLPFARKHEDDVTAAWVEDESIIFDIDNYRKWNMPRADLALNGLHNLYNSMAAGLSASFLNIRKDTIREALSDFKGVEHRLEYVETVKGVRYINDSKATNVDSCWYALESMPKGDKKVVLILGGKDKGNDYSQIQKLVDEKVKAIVALGKDNSKILEFFKSTPVIDTHDLDSAVNACAALANEGDVVLLSPCCASFDLFANYEQRGEMFKDKVKQLKKTERK